LPEWVDHLSLQQQAVLILGCRGPDGFPKYHQSKPLLYFYRSCIISAAHTGRHLRVGEHVNSLLTLRGFDDDGHWADQLSAFFDVVDELPLHYFTHLMHGAQIVAYKHPATLFRRRWLEFYQKCCDYLHVPIENEDEMDDRLSDFGRPLDKVLG
jgi:hypothetical protein